MDNIIAVMITRAKRLTVVLLSARHRNAEGLIFYHCVFSFLRRLISEVTKRISTKLGHIFTYDCYLKNLVRTPLGICPHGLGGKKRLLGTNFEL